MRERSVPIDYATAVGAMAAAVFARWALTPLIGDRLPFGTLFGAVAIAVWFGGAWPALLAAALGYLAAELLFIAPGSPIATGITGRAVPFGVYLSSCLLIIGLGSPPPREARQPPRSRDAAGFGRRRQPFRARSSNRGAIH